MTTCKKSKRLEKSSKSRGRERNAGCGGGERFEECEERSWDDRGESGLHWGIWGIYSMCLRGFQTPGSHIAACTGRDKHYRSSVTGSTPS